MIADPVLLLVLALLGAGGARFAARACRVADPFLSWALGLPLALSALLLVSETLVPILPLWACLLVGLALVGAVAWFSRAPAPEPEFQPLDRGLRWLVALLLASLVFYLHITQLIRPADDFWIQYPLTRSLVKGTFPAVNPYHPDLPLQGDRGRPLLLATLSTTVGGDTLRTQWILELVLALNSALLWILALRRASGNARAGVLGGMLVFLGVNVGSRVGLLDAYDNENLLVYLLLAALLALGAEILRTAAWRWPIPLPLLAGATLVAGACGTLSATHYVLALATFLLGCALVGYRRKSVARILRRAVPVVVLGSLLLALAQGSALRSLVLHPGAPAPELHPPAWQPQPLRISFPKDPFLALRLGVDPYQRFSFALDTALFRRYQPALDDGGYASIFGPKVLVLHWLPTWLAPLTLAWSVWRRNLVGVLLGCFGVLAFLTPGVVDFGPIREAAFLRWEFASGLAFAALLGVTLADLWEHRPSGTRGKLLASLVVLILLTDMVGAQRRLNDLVIELQRDSGLLSRVIMPWYPRTTDWLAQLPSLRLSESDLEATAWLWREAGPDQRLLTDFSTAGQDSVDRQAALAGLAGVFPVGHALPPRWLPMGYPPDMPSEPTVAFRQTRNPDTLAGLGVDWLLEAPRQSTEPPAGLSPTVQFGPPAQIRRLYRLKETGVPGSLHMIPPPVAVEATVEGLPGPHSWAAGVAYPVTVHFSHPLDGWLAPVLRDPDGNTVNRFSPVTCRVQGKSARAWLVPPLEEGDYRLSWTWSPGGNEPWRSLNGEVAAGYRFSQAIEEGLRVEHLELGDNREVHLILRNTGSRTFAPGAPLRIQWWVWDPERHRYRVPFAPEGEVLLDGPLPPGTSRNVEILLDSPMPRDGRVDITAAAPHGPSISVPRWQP
jgi:hypothetical protein